MSKSGVVEEGGIAVAETATVSPYELADRISLAADDRRRQGGARALSRWRALVETVADGGEPTGKQLQEIADLADTLRLPAGSLAADVAALQRHRGAAAELAKCQAAREGFEEKRGLLVTQLRAAEESQRRTRLEIQRLEILPIQVANALRERDEILRVNPRLFADADILAESLLAKVSS